MIRNWSSLGLFLLKSRTIYLDSQSIFFSDASLYTDKGYVNSLKLGRLELDLTVTRKRLYMRLLSSFFSSYMLVFFRFTRHSFIFKNVYLRQSNLCSLDSTLKGFPLPIQLNWFIHKNLKYLNYARQLQLNLTHFNLNKSPFIIFSNFLLKIDSCCSDINLTDLGLESNTRLVYFFKANHAHNTPLLFNNLFKSILNFKYYRTTVLNNLSISQISPVSLNLIFNKFLPGLAKFSFDLSRITPTYFEKLFKIRQLNDEKPLLREYAILISNLKPKYINNRVIHYGSPVFFDTFVTSILQLKRMLVVMICTFI